MLQLWWKALPSGQACSSPGPGLWAASEGPRDLTRRARHEGTQARHRGGHRIFVHLQLPWGLPTHDNKVDLWYF